MTKARVNVPTYRDLPVILTTNEEMYAVFVRAAQVVSSKNQYRMKQKGLTPTDVADELFLRYLQAFKPRHRSKTYRGKPTKLAVPLFVPVKKSTAYYIIQRDVRNYLQLKTKEEKAGVTLTSLPEE